MVRNATAKEMPLEEGVMYCFYTRERVPTTQVHNYRDYLNSSFFQEPAKIAQAFETNRPERLQLILNGLNISPEVEVVYKDGPLQLYNPNTIISTLKAFLERSKRFGAEDEAPESRFYVMVGDEIYAEKAAYRERKAGRRERTEPQDKSYVPGASKGMRHSESPTGVRTKVMSREEEREYLRNAKVGDEEAIEKLVQANQGLVYNIAKRYLRSRIPLEDLVNEGNDGLMIAIEKFNLSKGWKLSTYAPWWIRERILKYVRENLDIVRKPGEYYEDYAKINKATKLLHKDNASLTKEDIDEISRMTRLPPEKVELRIRQAVPTSSFHKRMEGRIFDWSERYEDPSPDRRPSARADRDMKAEYVQSLLQYVTEREREVLSMRYGLNDQQEHTQREIAQAIGVTRERARQIEKKALEKIYSMLKAKKALDESQNMINE